MVTTGAIQKVISIPPTQDNLDLQNRCHYSCLEILWVVACGNASVLQKARDTRGMQGLLKFTLHHGIKSY